MRIWIHNTDWYLQYVPVQTVSREVILWFNTGIDKSYFFSLWRCSNAHPSWSKIRRPIQLPMTADIGGGGVTLLWQLLLLSPNTAANAHLLWWCPCCLRGGEGSLWHTPLAAAAAPNTAANAHLLWWCPCCLRGGEGSLWHTPLAAAASCYRHLWPIFGALQHSSCAPALPGKRYAAYE